MGSNVLRRQWKHLDKEYCNENENYDRLKNSHRITDVGNEKLSSTPDGAKTPRSRTVSSIANILISRVGSGNSLFLN